MSSNGTSTRPEVILGAGLFGGARIPNVDDVQAFTDTFRAHGHTRIDSAAGYPVDAMGKSERMLAACRATAWCTLDTKVLSVGKGTHSRDNVIKCMEQSLKNLGFDGDNAKGKVDIMYLHMPALDTPLEETVGAMNEGFQRGWFKRFGLSNYAPRHVEEICEIAKRNGWVMPSVYQGQYNPVSRAGEKDLFPVLRKHGISFFAYTPTAAGLFSGKVTADSVNRPEGRFSKDNAIGQFFSAIYLRPELLKLADRVHTTATRYGFDGHQAALRWCLHHSILSKELGDGIVVGAGTLEQLKGNLRACDDGPLPDELAKVFEEIWPLAEPIAPYAYVDALPETLVESFNKDEN